jgi:hypothetical protein
MRRLVSFAGLVGTFLIAYACQRWAYHLQASVSQSLHVESYLWLSSLTGAIAATPLILLSWYVLHGAAKDVWVSSVFVVVGIAVTFGYAIEVSLHSHPIPDALAESLVPRSYVHYTGGLVMVTGIASLFLPRGSDKTRQQTGQGRRGTHDEA